ncbi:MAG: hypothetical protein KDD36_06880 [Flavobacteriales bacterium]|nr:hypothetical protein [Flavobacteriales bacterium]
MPAKAQYGNEWINYQQTYFKFPITSDGIYRISFTTLANAGVPVNTIDPRNLQIFGRGQEIFIYVEGESDGIFNPSDYIVFHASGNNGWLDQKLYKNGNVQGNPDYSLFTDTAYYFLTWNQSTTNSRMTSENDVAFGNYTEASWFYKTYKVALNNTYYPGKLDSRGSSDAEYITGEGWMGPALSLGASATYNLPVSKIFTGGPDATYTMDLYGASGTAHHTRLTMAGQTWDTIYSGYGHVPHNGSVPVSGLIDPITPLTLTSINDQGAPADRSALAVFHLTYPHLTNLEGKTSFSFTVPDATGQSKTYLRMSSFNDLGSPTWLYDVTSNRRIKVIKSGGLYHALVTNSGKNKTCWMVSENGISEVVNIRKATFTGKFTDYTSSANSYDYLIIAGEELVIDAGLYKNYRASIAGGGYKPIVVNVEELYDQYAYGVKKHPLAIRSFCDMALNVWAGPPKYLFLMGKSIHAHDENTAFGFRRNKQNFENCLVPSFGNPSSDVLFTAGLGSASGLEPALSTGRLAANSSEEVQLYLAKVISYESQEPAEWMKRAIHFGGGSDFNEAERFKGHLYEYEQSISDTSFGAVVYTFSKSTADPIQVNLSDSVAQLINSGVSIMTFFGHATSSGFDQNVDAPENFSNKDRYPWIVANSCFAGNIHLSGTGSVSEQWMLTANGGSIAFLAQVGLGVEYYTHDYSKTLFQHFSGDMYGMPVGDQIRQTISDIQSSLWPWKATVLEMTLHGDPAVRINTQLKPDYTISSPYVYFNPEEITNETDSFDVHLIIRNLGRAIRDSFYVEVERYLPDGTLGQVINHIADAPSYKDTIEFRLPVDLALGIGLNRLQISIDDLDEIDELSENNNFLSVDFLIKSNDILPVYPYEFAIVPNDQVTLKASTSDPLAPLKSYRFEIDTTDAFSAPLASTTLSGVGGVISWQPALTLTDSTVYYWRVSPDSTSTQGFNWRNSSFQYIDGRIGWEQAHFFQFRKDKYNLISFDEPERDFDFVNNAGALQCKTKGSNNSSPWPHEYSINGTVTDYGACTGTPSIHVAILDSLSLKPWNTAEYTNFGHANCLGCCPGRARPENYFIFRSGDAVQRDSLLSLLQKIPNGNYVLLYTVFGGQFNLWSSALKNKLTAMGATLINGLANDQPYIFFAQKGNIASAIDTAGANSFAAIEINKLLTNVWYQGDLTSTVIGPATAWNTLHYRQRPQDAGASDELRLSVIGIRKDGSEATLVDTTAVDSLWIYPDVPSGEFPYLKLNAFIKDDSLRTPTQIKRWQVVYDPAPEAALLPNLAFSLENDTVQEGEFIKVRLAAGNIGDVDMADSLLVQYWIQDANRNRHDFPVYRVKRLLVSDTVNIAFDLPTQQLNGDITVWVEVNPFNASKGTYDQPEQYHFNNILQTAVHINKDIENPILDVTFDGMHILNGEIISARPEIFIRLTDENPWLALDDTSLFEVYLKEPGSIENKRIYFIQNGQVVLNWTPASLPKNRFEIAYHPVFTLDGSYEMQIRAKDASKNISGSGNGVYDYTIRFEIVNQSTITNVVNYPNPFTTSTRFVFTLTGSAIPDDFRIQIMTVSGKVVREISREELGDLRIGKNITSFAWDGTDQFGDRLANGLYLYRVVTRINGSDIEHMDSNLDQYFHSGFGKMYLFR